MSSCALNSTVSFSSRQTLRTTSIAISSLVSSDLFSGQLSRVSGESPGTYAIQQNTLSAGPNYLLTYVGADLTITPANATLTLGNLNQTYDGTPRIAFAIQAPEFSWPATYNAAVEARQREAYPDIDLIISGTGLGETDTQVATIEDLLVQQPDALIIDAVHQHPLHAAVATLGRDDSLQLNERTDSRERGVKRGGGSKIVGERLPEETRRHHHAVEPGGALRPDAGHTFEPR